MKNVAYIKIVNLRDIGIGSQDDKKTRAPDSNILKRFKTASKKLTNHIFLTLNKGTKKLRNTVMTKSLRNGIGTKNSSAKSILRMTGKSVSTFFTC